MITVLGIIALLIIIGWAVHDVQHWCEQYSYKRHFED